MFETHFLIGETSGGTGVREKSRKEVALVKISLIKIVFRVT